jgi:CIC family chloride channel protein
MTIIIGYNFPRFAQGQRHGVHCWVLGAGFLGVAYNPMLSGTLAAADKLRRWPLELRAAVVGAAVGILAWFEPDLVGGVAESRSAPLFGTEAVG